MALRRASGTRVTHFFVFFADLLVIVNVIGTGEDMLTAGHIGHFNPEKLENTAGKDCMIWLPGFGKGVLGKGVFIALGIKANLEDDTAPMIARNGGPVLRLPAIVK